MYFLGVHDVFPLAMKAYYTLAFTGMGETDAEAGTSPTRRVGRNGRQEGVWGPLWAHTSTL